MTTKRSKYTAEFKAQSIKKTAKSDGNISQTAKGLIIHSDRRSQYCSHAYHHIIEKHEFVGSMSRKGITSSTALVLHSGEAMLRKTARSYDNAPIESFWSVVKNELIYHEVYETREQAVDDITNYIEFDYNQTRIQKGLSMRPPRQVRFDYFKQVA